MAEYAVRSGTTAPNPLYTGNDATDAEALVFEDPLGTRVGGISPAGLVRMLGTMPATPQGGILQFGGSMHVARFHYDFAVLGGQVGTIALASALGIPLGAIVYGGLLYVSAAPTSADSTATIALQLNAANDIVNAAAVSGAPWSTTGQKAIIPVCTAATSVRATAARDLSMVIGVEALTAGVFDAWLMYFA